MPGAGYPACSMRTISFVQLVYYRGQKSGKSCRKSQFEGSPNRGKKVKNTQANSTILKPLLIGAGSLSLGVGILGIFLPVLPTTPFILVSGFCFARSSTRLHSWLLTSRLTKNTYTRILNKEGMTLRMKLAVLAAAWIMLILAALFLAKSTAMRIVYPSLGVVKTVVFFTVIKTAHKGKRNEP